jgi:RNA polymerase sigma factor (sigma-70 family)
VADEYAIEVAEWEAIARRDPDAFGRWFARHDIPLKRSLRTFSRDVDVEAIVQDTAIRVWERASTIVPDGRPAFLMRWATTVAKNNARNEVKRATCSTPPGSHGDNDPPRVRRQLPLAEGDHHLDTTFAVVGSDPWLRARILRCLEELSPILRRAIDAVLAEGGQRPYREVAAARGMSHDSLRQNLKRARNALEQCLGLSGIALREYLR